MIKYGCFRKSFLTIFLVCITGFGFGQTNYFEQDFSGGGPFFNANPNAGQFSHLITTNPALSKYEFGPGYMDLIRLRLDSATGGLVRALRAVPFSPNPETLYIQITFSVEEISASATNAVYFYSGENFSPTNNKIPANVLLFSRFSLNFLASAFVVHDIETGKNSSALPLRSPVTLTWVLNNSSDGQIYRKPETSAKPDYKVMPGKYDLWVDGTLLIDEADAYPGASVYSLSKPSNFEIRFRNGVGRVRFRNLRIRDIHGILPLHLVSFQGRKENGQVELRWETDLEQDRDIYVIKKSRDKIAFTTIGTIKAMKEAGNHYSFADRGPFDPVNHYRLEKIDQYGSLIDSRALVISDQAESLFLIMPNPASPDLIRVNTCGKGWDTLKLWDLTGREIGFDVESGNNGVLEIHPYQKMSPGFYILSVIQGEQVQHLRILIK